MLLVLISEQLDAYNEVFVVGGVCGCVETWTVVVKCVYPNWVTIYRVCSLEVTHKHVSLQYTP